MIIKIIYQMGIHRDSLNPLPFPRHATIQGYYLLAKLRQNLGHSFAKDYFGEIYIFTIG
jgi:hypothetical protein